jgi:hypothetical protein
VNEARLLRSSATLGVSAAMFLGAMLAAPAVAAQEVASDDGSASEPAERPTERWYGWQTLAADGVSNGLLLTGVIANEQGFVTAWMITFPLSGPTLHAFHRRPLATGVSLGLRVGLPVFGALVVGLGENPLNRCFNPQADMPGGPAPSDDSLCPPPDILAGAAVGGILASGFDAGFLAFEEPEARPKLGSAKGRETVFVAPRLVLHRDTLAVGVVGGF